MPGKATKILAKIAWAICLMTGIVLGIKSLREPDIWWQLRTGEWIINNHTVPYKDIFTFTFYGTPWVNVKWGFEVLMQCMASIGGPEFTPVLQCIANVLILVFVIKTYNILRKNISGENSNFPSASIVLASMILLLACAFRFIGRPEMASHVFTAIFLFFILRNHFSPSSKIYWLIPMQALWANLHEAYGTGMVMVGIAVFAAWVEYYLQSRNVANKKPKTPLALTLTAIGVILAPAIHPYGLEMIIHPFEIFSQVEKNKFTTELLGYNNPEYWQMEAYINVVLFVIGFALLFLKNSQSAKVKWYERPVKSFGVAYLLFFFVFFYLSLTAYRNISFFIIIVIPLIANGLDTIFAIMKKRFAWLRKTGWPMVSYIFLIAIGIMFYISIADGKFYKTLEGDHDRYGLKVNPLTNPIGAAQYVHDHNLQGNCFSDYLVSNYLLWDLRPNFETFIDLRDLDIFPADFFNHFNLLSVQPEIFPNIDKVADFKYAVILRRSFDALHSYFANNPDWRTVYADPVAVVYLKKDGSNKATMQLFNAAPKEVVFHAPAHLHNSQVAQIFSSIFWPFYNPGDYEKFDNDLIAASYYKTIGHLDAALASAKKASTNNIANWSGQDMIGNIYLDMASRDTDKTRAQNYLSLANNAYNAAIDENKKDDFAYLGLGQVSMRTNDIASAVSYFKEALKFNTKNFLTYFNLAQCQNYYTGGSDEDNNKYLDERIKYLKKAYALNQDQRIRFYLGIACGQRGDCDGCNEYLDTNTLKYPGLPESDKRVANSLLLKCGR